MDSKQKRTLAYHVETRLSLSHNTGLLSAALHESSLRRGRVANASAIVEAHAKNSQQQKKVVLLALGRNFAPKFSHAKRNLWIFFCRTMFKLATLASQRQKVCRQLLSIINPRRSVFFHYYFFFLSFFFLFRVPFLAPLLIHCLRFRRTPR